MLDLTSLGEQTGVAVRMLLLHHRTGEAARKGREDGFPTVGLGTLLANLMERPNYYHVGGSLGSWDFSSMPEHHWEDEEDRCFAGALDRKVKYDWNYKIKNDLRNFCHRRNKFQ